MISCQKHLLSYYMPNPSPSVPLSTEIRLLSKQVEKLFLQKEGDIGMGWSSKKEGNKEWSLSQAIQNYMTPSLYLCCRLISLVPRPSPFNLMCV